MLQWIHKRRFKALGENPKVYFEKLKAQLDYNTHNDFPDRVLTIWGSVTESRFKIIQSTGMWSRGFPVVCEGLIDEANTIKVVCRAGTNWISEIMLAGFNLFVILNFNFWGVLFLEVLFWPLNYYFYSKDVRNIVQYLNDNTFDGNLVPD